MSFPIPRGSTTTTAIAEVLQLIHFVWLIVAHLWRQGDESRPLHTMKLVMNIFVLLIC